MYIKKFALLGVMLCAVTSIFEAKNAFGEVDLMSLEELSEADLAKATAQAEAVLRQHEKEYNRLKNKWINEPSPILAERLKRENYLEELKSKIENLSADYEAFTSEQERRKQDKEETKEYERLKAEAEKKNEAEKLRVAKEKEAVQKEKDELLGELDEDAKRKLQILTAETELRNKENQRKLDAQLASERRMHLAIIVLVMVVVFGAVMFIVMKMLNVNGRSKS